MGLCNRGAYGPSDDRRAGWQGDTGTAPEVHRVYKAAGYKSSWLLTYIILFEYIEFCVLQKYFF